MNKLKSDDLIWEFQKRGFHYGKDLLFNYYISLISKPFVILTGISGSGKSKIAEIFAEIIGGEKSYELIPVKPNWRDGKGLFGYHNLIEGSYYITPLIKLFLRALKDKDNPYFLILDEMNIAKTEHYFADYLSLIESRRTVEERIGNTLADLKAAFHYEGRVKLSEAIILSALDINKPGAALKVEEYRQNRFSELWKEKYCRGDNWTAQFRSELNQGEGRLAYRVFEKAADGQYLLKDKSMLSPDDAATVERLEKLYHRSVNRKYIIQDNMVLHNHDKCIGADGRVCQCSNCPYRTEERYKCSDLYDKASEQYLVPSKLPIPLNVFTIGTVNVDETTYMFSPKVLDRSNVIEFNEVDLPGIYALTQAQKTMIDSVSGTVSDSSFFFNAGSDMPEVAMTLPGAETVNVFLKTAPDEFNSLLIIFTILKKYNMHFGYRVMNEIAGYMCNVFRHTSYSERARRAFDNQILQKILPKFYGAYEKIWNPLAEILGNLLSVPADFKGLDGNGIVEELHKISSGEIKSLELCGTTANAYFKYPKSAIKILEMLSDLEHAGFASFIR